MNLKTFTFRELNLLAGADPGNLHSFLLTGMTACYIDRLSGQVEDGRKVEFNSLFSLAFLRCRGNPDFELRAFSIHPHMAFLACAGDNFQVQFHLMFSRRASLPLGTKRTLS